MLPVAIFPFRILNPPNKETALTISLALTERLHLLSIYHHWQISKNFWSKEGFGENLL